MWRGWGPDKFRRRDVVGRQHVEILCIHQVHVVSVARPEYILFLLGGSRLKPSLVRVPYGTAPTRYVIGLVKGSRDKLG